MSGHYCGFVTNHSFRLCHRNSVKPVAIGSTPSLLLFWFKKSWRAKLCEDRIIHSEHNLPSFDRTRQAIFNSYCQTILPISYPKKKHIKQYLQTKLLTRVNRNGNISSDSSLNVNLANVDILCLTFPSAVGCSAYQESFTWHVNKSPFCS